MFAANLVPTRLEGMETSGFVHWGGAAPLVPTRLEGMETKGAAERKKEANEFRPDLRGWKLFKTGGRHGGLPPVPTRLEGMET